MSSHDPPMFLSQATTQTGLSTDMATASDMSQPSPLQTVQEPEVSASTVVEHEPSAVKLWRAREARSIIRWRAVAGCVTG